MSPTKTLASSAVLLGLLAGSSITPALAQQTFDTQKAKILAETVVDGLENPWGLAFLPDGGAIVTERDGRMRIIADGKLSEPVAGVPQVAASGQGGLLDVALSPDFATDNLIFFSYSEPGEGGQGTSVARAKLVRDGASAKLEDLTTIFSMAKKTGTSHHFGSRLVFRPDGTLFITTGDRGQGDRAQDMQDSAGAVIRINADGSVPADNPDANGAKGLPILWSKGHRNIQGATFDPVINALVTVEHGAKGGDEINYPEAGKNYGWPVITYGVDYSGAKIGTGTEAPGFEQPQFYWDPSIAPSGLASYQGDMFAQWKGDLLVGSLKFGQLSRLERDDAGKITGEERMFEAEFGRIRDVNVAPDGSVWLLTDESDGAIIRLSAG
ncbi:PQQ-dependent sugar dehydrogenase [Mesorhizobium sp. YR577]|uniref:PQQ-dependent sugar dehydrogenase n=1 Tax=Mesorhizobium sp. YR577 TaxID=1884373 RepID=UPI0008E9CBA0|nr:PQQ-dependent sugar dehydrogenase [Mesorhizobium sp. YR577]SFT86294.1 Glucose/arabinose dehydrogenase, beta-propeller fold [Mesorhizobium sp. YR577]